VDGVASRSITSDLAGVDGGVASWYGLLRLAEVVVAEVVSL
jgi:hypothetical protein